MSDPTDESAWPLDDPMAPTIPEAWRLDPQPTTFIAFWQDDMAPTREEVIRALREATDEFEILEDELPGAPEHVRWNVVVRGPELMPAFILWCEAAQPVPEEPPPEFAAIKRCPHIIGFETMLPPNSPVEGYASAIRWILDALDPVPIILDANLGTYMNRGRLTELLAQGDVNLPGDLLWVVHIEGREGEDGPAWVYTSGLHRCGRPELEMIDVPGEHAQLAMIVLNGLGEIVLEMTLPAPGETFEIGARLPVTAQPWDIATAHLETDALASRGDREGRGDESFLGPRAVICAPKPRGMYRPSWVYPADVLNRLANDEATLFGSSRATKRQERLARHTWPELAMTFAALRRGRENEPPEEGDVAFLLKAGFQDSEHPERGREHLWFLVERFDGDRAEGVLLNQPVFVSGMNQGERQWVDRELLSDWLVRSESRDVVPAMASELRELVETIRGSEHGEST